MDKNVERKVKSEIEIYKEPLQNQDIDNIIKYEMGNNEEPIQIQDVDRTVGEDMVKYELLKETTDFYHAKHQISHIGDKLCQYNCSQCNNAFTLKANILYHEILHTGERLYLCRNCDKDFTQKLYQCNQCNKTFTERRGIIRHQKTHTGEKPYQCSQCDMVFSQNSNLKMHMRTHTGEKPY
ncbi:unnamed protein product, partial [Meganyctiphanes norvegica]